MHFAETELQKYSCMMGISVDITLHVNVDFFETSTFSKFDPRFDDAFKIAVNNGKGTITGTNERAVLIGVYHYFKMQGCRFLRPGKDGEYIPLIDTPCDVNESWYANVRHRGTTSMKLWSSLSGYDSVLDYLDWMPKMAMNTFFNELEDYYSFVKETYGSDTPFQKGVDYPHESYSKEHALTIKALKDRHLLYHNAGHGWTIKMMEGIETLSFEEDFTPCLNMEILAQTNGKRQIFNHKPMHTNLCYSNPKVRRGMASLVRKYALDHPETDCIHFWLADYYANFCQCDECKKKRPSDWYIMILNEIDKELTEIGSEQKVVFLIYFELLYVPLYEKLNNPDRFIMMFCPYGRNFSQPYRNVVPAEYEPKLNNDFSTQYMDMGLYLKQLQDWKEIFKGDSFVFDYSFYNHAYFENICQINYITAPYLNSKDLKNYGLNGRIECGYVRAMTPTALGFYTMFNELFYGDTDYTALYRDYFESSYGKDQKISIFLEEVSSLMPYAFIYNQRSTFTEEEKTNIQAILDKIHSFKEYLVSHLPDHHSQRTNVRYFNEFICILESYVKLLKAASCKTSQKELGDMIKDFEYAMYKAESVMPNYIVPGPLLTYLKWPFEHIPT